MTCFIIVRRVERGYHRAVEVSILCGSTREGSLNRQVARLIWARLQGLGFAVHDVGVSQDLAAFNPDRADAPPSSVVGLQNEFAAAAGVVFVVPEYAGGPPGWVKNLTDWMVGSASLYQRPVIVVSASTGGGRHAISQLSRTLTWQGALVVATCGIESPVNKMTNGEIVDDATRSALDFAVSRLSTSIAGGLEQAESLAFDTLGPLGIDPQDRRT